MPAMRARHPRRIGAVCAFRHLNEDSNGEIVGGAALVGGIDEAAASRFGVGVAGELLDFGVGNHRPEAIAAHDQSIMLLDRRSDSIDRGDQVLAEAAAECRTVGMSACTIGRHQAHADALADDRMVARELFDLAVAHTIEAAVAAMRTVEHAFAEVDGDGGCGGRHAA